YGLEHLSHVVAPPGARDYERARDPEDPRRRSHHQRRLGPRQRRQAAADAGDPKQEQLSPPAPDLLGPLPDRPQPEHVEPEVQPRSMKEARGDHPPPLAVEPHAGRG